LYDLIPNRDENEDENAYDSDAAEVGTRTKGTKPYNPRKILPQPTLRQRMKMKYKQLKEMIKQSKKRIRGTTNQDIELKEADDDDEEILMFHSKKLKQGNPQEPAKEIQKRITISLPQHITRRAEINTQPAIPGITQFDTNITPERGAAALRHLRAAHQS
jgi:hypothetical protein